MIVDKTTAQKLQDVAAAIVGMQRCHTTRSAPGRYRLLKERRTQLLAKLKAEANAAK